jgi:hypothetical protein
MSLLISANAQSSFWFGPKGGPTLAFQQWNNFDRQPLRDWHIAAFIESYNEDDDDSGSFFAQVGYHTRGSAIRIQNSFTFNTNSVGFRFNNASLLLGVKRPLPVTGKLNTYYLVGLRGEYTVNTNLDDFAAENTAAGSLFYPFPEFVNKINYGVSMGAGAKFKLSEFIGAFVDITISPDLSFQYQQPAIGNVIGPFGNPTTIGERQIRNLTLEISLGINFLRKVIWEE